MHILKDLFACPKIAPETKIISSYPMCPNLKMLHSELGQIQNIHMEYVDYMTFELWNIVMFVNNSGIKVYR